MSDPTSPFGRKRGFSLTMLEERLIALESLVQQIPSRQLDRTRPVLSDPITQSGHGFAIGDVVARNPSDGLWSKAGADTAPDAVAIVDQVNDANTFVVVLAGLYVAPGLRDDTNAALSEFTSYYLSTTAGKLTIGTATPIAAPNTWREVLRSLKNGLVLIVGPDVDNHDHDLTDARDLDVTALALGCVPVYSPDQFGTGIGGWKATPAPALASLAALTVFGNATNAAAAGAAIGPAPANAVLVCNAAGTALTWGQVATAGLADGSVTALKLGSDVTLEALKDVSITTTPSDSRVTNDFLTWNGTAWVNRNLGPAICLPIPGAGSAVQSQFALDGGSGASVTSVVAVGKAGSRFYLAATCALDFEIDGTASDNTEHVCRLLTDPVGVKFYDRARGAANGSTAGAIAGTEVMEWGSAGTAALRYFRFGIDVSFADSSGSVSAANALTIHGQASGQWRVFSAAGNFLDIYNADPVVTGRAVYSLCNFNVDGTNTLSIGGTNAGKLSFATSTLNFAIGAGSTVFALQAAKVGFFGTTPAVQQTINAAITQLASSPGSTYNQTNEVAMFGDTTNCISAINALRTALRNLGLAV